MKRRIVTSFDQRFYLDPDDFYKTFVLCRGMKKIVEIIGYLELLAINPTGFSQQFTEEGLLPDAQYAHQYFLDGTERNTDLRKVLESTTLISCRIEPLRNESNPSKAAAWMKCEFRRGGQPLAQIEFIYEQDGGGEICCSRFGLTQAA